MNQVRNYQILNSFSLKLIAMFCMLCDHIYASIAPGNPVWMTNLGRIAFPIFAFELVEGYFHTHSYKQYLKRMFLMALISEIPFNLIVGGSAFYPFHQNVLFTFTLSLIVIKLIDHFANAEPLIKYSTLIGFSLLGFIIGTVTMCDYFGFGVLTVITFYLAHKTRYSKLVMLLGLYLINIRWLGSMYLVYHLGNFVIEIPQQGFALFALIPIFLYNGELGKQPKAFKWFAYWFYPLHLAILYCLACII